MNFESSCSSKILASNDTPQSPTLDPREARNKDLAFQHAYLIQQQKNVEFGILIAIESLLYLPSSPTSNPNQPSRADAARVQELLQAFRPADYDSLIEERNIDRKCGYVLCSKAHRLEEPNLKCRLLQSWAGEKGVEVIEKMDRGRWCSEECARMALFLRVQLNEVPAWERAEQANTTIELYGQIREKRQSG